MAVSASALNSAADQIAGLKGVAQSNSAFNAEQAQIQREWAGKAKCHCYGV